MLAEKIHELVRKGMEEKEAGLRLLSVKDIGDLATSSGSSLRDVEIAALEQEVIPRRYLRNVAEFGISGQLTLLKSHAAVVGLGGLGGFMLEHLLRLGVGELTLIDGDAFEESNLNRQLLSEVRLLGTPKIQAAQARALVLNPAVHTHFHKVFIRDDNGLELLGNAQVVLDGLDQIQARFSLERNCRQLGVPFIHGAVSSWSGQVMTIFPEGPGLELLYSNERRDAANSVAEDPMLPMAAACIASIQVAEAVKVLLGREDVLRDQALFMDISQNSFQVIEFKKEY